MYKYKSKDVTLKLTTGISLLLLFIAISRDKLPKKPTKDRCCGPGCRTRDFGAEKHYDPKYFAWQTKLGKEKAENTDWTKLIGIKDGDVVADLGAGGGHILNTIKNAKRLIAVELNEHARSTMNQMYPQIETYTYPEELEDESVDVFYSTSAIEHFECPIIELREMGKKLKKGGRVVVGIKNEGIHYAVGIKMDDIDQHIYTWNRQILYNLMQHAGFTVREIRPLQSEMINSPSKFRNPKSIQDKNSFIYHWVKGIKV